MAMTDLLEEILLFMKVSMLLERWDSLGTLWVTVPMWWLSYEYIVLNYLTL